MFRTISRKQLTAVILSPAFVVFCLSLLILTAQIVAIGRIRPFNSDDLYWQQVVRTWVPFSGHTLYLATKDIFIEQVPFFALLEHFFQPSRGLVIGEVLLLTISSFSLFYVSSLYFLKKLKIKTSYLTLLPFLWLASFGYPLVQNYLNSNWRSFEIGLCFATIVLVAAISFGDIQKLNSLKSKLLFLLATAFIGAVIYSDPYYVFFTIGPLLLFVAGLYALKKINRYQLSVVVGGAALSVVVAKLISAIATKAGVVLVADTPSVFVNFDNIITNIVSSLHGLLIVFGADFFGRPAFGLSTFGALINALILSFVIYEVYQLRHIMRQPTLKNLSLAQLWAAFFGLLIAFVFIVYTSTTLVAVSNYRFFIVLIYAAVTFLVVSLGTLKNNALKLIIGMLLVGAVIYNVTLSLLTHSIRQQPDAAINISNSVNYRIIDAVHAEGLTKGYGSYWQGNINTYLSKGSVTFLPSLCDTNGQTVNFKWLIDGNQFNKPADKSFYLVDPDFPAPGICTEKQLVAQFGEPQKILKISNKSILVYDYDISSKIKLSLPEY
jgi:hypothetical protein